MRKEVKKEEIKAEVAMLEKKSNMSEAGEDMWVMMMNSNGGKLHSRHQKHLRIASFLGSKDRDYLISPSGNQVKVADLESKVVGLYFSANWYLPCRNFTPVLAGVYEHSKRKGVGFEVVYVSSDENSDAFNSYRATMPWLAIPFSDLETKKELNRRFNIEGIPCLIVLQPNDIAGNETLHDGVELIYRYGVRAFPFTRNKLKELEEEEKQKHENQTITNLLTSQDRGHLLSHNTTEQVTVASLVGKTIGLYFSAQWCIPCHKFTPTLISIYHKIKQKLAQDVDKNDFEIVFISSDRDQVAFDTYYSTMPWLALPFKDPTVKALTKYFEVQCIPSLVIIGPNGQTITKQGRNLVNLYLEKAYPFTETQRRVLEKQMDEEAESLPRYEHHEGHRHELRLVSEGTGGGPFICCDCEEQGSGWAYQCIECGYEVHTKCVRPVSRDECSGGQSDN